MDRKNIDIAIAGETRGDLARRGASGWERVAALTSGNVITGDGTDVVSAATPRLSRLRRRRTAQRSEPVLTL